MIDPRDLQFPPIHRIQNSKNYMNFSSWWLSQFHIVMFTQIFIRIRIHDRR